MVNKSVQLGDIDPNLKTETVRQKIRDEYLKDSTVTVVLIGKDTWRRKHIDWEIAASLRETKNNKRSGVIGILLPSHSEYNQVYSIWDEDISHNVDPHTIPPRLADNLDNGFVKIYKWIEDRDKMARWIDQAFDRRNTIYPDNSRTMFSKNREQRQTKWVD